LRGVAKDPASRPAPVRWERRGGEAAHGPNPPSSPVRVVGLNAAVGRDVVSSVRCERIVRCASADDVSPLLVALRVRRQRLGVWVLKRLPAAAWARTPTRDWALLRIPLARFYGEKVLYALVGLCIPPLLAALCYLLDLRLPVVVPVVATLGLAAVMFWLPDVNVRDDAKKARAEFPRALGAHIDLVALERHSGSGTRQAMEVAADVGWPHAHPA
jgi:hypothetical protein